jgi:TolB-like protein/AraC-like DNA-binding protein
VPDNSKHIRLSLKDQILFDKAQRIVSEHLSEESFGIEELRHGLGLSRSQMHRRLLKITGLSASVFIRSVRLKKALELLKEGNLTVSEVAYRTGFSSPSYFNKCFHEQYGFPPGDIHKQKMSEIDQRDLFGLPNFPGTIADKSKLSQSRKYYFIGLALVLILISVIVYYGLRNPSARIEIPEKSIAVLPFKNFSDNRDNKYISDGMMDAILSNISKISDLKVISRTSVEQYRESTKPARQIGMELGVHHILEGSTFQESDHIRITVQLISTQTDEHIWSESYETDRNNIFEVQTLIAERIAAELQSKITAEELIRIKQIPTNNPIALDQYQKAHYYFINYLQQMQEQDYQTSMELFKRAIQEDSSFASAYTRMAELYWTRNYRIEYHNDMFMDTVLLWCRKALSFDSQSSDAYRIIGQYYFETGERGKGINALETAISLNRNNAAAYEVLGFYYNWLGNWEVGIPFLLKSIQLDPFSIFLPFRYGYLARAYLDLLDFDKAFFYSQRAIELGGGRRGALGFAHWVIAHSHLMLGNSEEALEAAERYAEYNEIGAYRIKAEVYCHLVGDFEQGLKMYRILTEKDPRHFNYRHRYAYALWETGKQDSARLLFDQQQREFEIELELGRIERNDPHYNLAGIHAFFEDYDKAFEHLNKHQFTSGLEIYAQRDPLFRSLRSNPEFQRIIQQALDRKKVLRAAIEDKTSENSTP